MDKESSRFFVGIGRNVIILGFVSVFNDIGSEAIFPILPLFLSNILMVEKSVIGLIEGAAEGSSSLLKIISGWFSDKTGARTRYILTGYGLSSFAKPLFAFATLWQHVFAIRVLDRIGKGVRTAPRDALIADSSLLQVRGRAFGFHRMMDTLGAIIGPLLTFLLLAIFSSSEAGFRKVFLFTAIPGLIAFTLIPLFVRDVKGKGGIESRFTLTLAKLDSKVRWFITVSSIFALGNFSYAFLVLRAQDLKIEPMYIPLLYLLFNVVYALLATPFGILSDKISKRMMISVGYSIFGAMAIGFALSSSPLHAMVLFVIYGIFHAINDGVQRAYVTQLTTPAVRASALGVFHASTGVMALPASFIAGLLWDLFTPETAFIYGAFLAFLASSLLLIQENIVK